MPKSPAGNSHGPFGPMVFPDPLTSTRQISAASFVYFDAPVVVPMPVWIPNDEAFGLNELILDRRPDWGLNNFRIDEIYGAQISAYQETMKLLKPLEDGFLRTLLAFDADTAARQEGLDFLESTGETVESVLPMLDVHAAAGEVFHHVLIDEYAANDGDLEKLFSYCSELFTRSTPAELLVSCYLPRLRLAPLTHNATDILLFNNVRLIPLLEKLPVEIDDQAVMSVATSIGAWEIFAQIFAQQLDPLDAKRVDALADVRARHMDEVRSLRNKCHRLAEDLPPSKDLLTLISTVEAFLRHNVNDEIAALFELNREAVGGFIESVLTDEKSWAAVAAAIGTPFAGQPLLTAGAAIATVSSLGAKAAKSAFERRSKLKASDYRVLYRVGKS